MLDFKVRGIANVRLQFAHFQMLDFAGSKLPNVRLQFAQLQMLDFAFPKNQMLDSVRPLPNVIRLRGSYLLPNVRLQANCL